MNSPFLLMQPGVEAVLPKNNNSESPFVSIAKTIHPISQEAQDFTNQKTFTVFVRKGEMLVSAGEHCSTIYYIKRGIFRSYIREGIKDITTWITGEQEFITPITSFGIKEPVKENIQALEDSELCGIRYDDLEYLYNHYPETNIVGRKILEKYFRDAEERAFIARLTEATSKYKRFIATKSNMLNRVPLKFIASYLGMTLETLSRIRSKLSRSPNTV
jgi:CRP-like cAMP-binding protein